MKSMIASRTSCATQRAVRSPQVLFLNACALLTAQRVPRFCAGVFAPELQFSSDTHQKLGSGTACFQKRLFRSRKIVSATGKIPSGGCDASRTNPKQLCLRPDAREESLPSAQGKKTSVNIVHRGSFFQASNSLASAHDFPIPSEAGQNR